MTSRIGVLCVALWLGLNLAGCGKAPLPPQQPSADIATVAATERWQALDVELSRLAAFLESRIALATEQRAAKLSTDQPGRLEAGREAQQKFRKTRAEAEREFLGGRVTAAVEKAEIARIHAHDGLRALGIDPD